MDARDELLEREGLGEIIVRAFAQALDAILDAAARGQYQNRRGILPRAQRAQHGKPVAVRQPQIEHGERIAVGRKHMLGIAGARDGIHGEAGALEPLREQFREIPVILDDKQPRQIDAPSP
jgi:hypothetical protein